MFTKQARHIAPDTDATRLLHSVTAALQDEQIAAELAGGVLTGVGPNAGNGVKPKISVRCTPGDAGYVIDTTVGMEIEQNTLILGVVTLLLFWPIALVLGVLAHQTFQQRADALLATVAGAIPGGRDAPYRHLAAPHHHP